MKTDPARYVLSDIERFSRHVIGVPLYPYQVEPLRAVIDSVLNRRGREFLLVFPRQSGKNEAIAGTQKDRPTPWDGPSEVRYYAGRDVLLKEVSSATTSY